MKYLDASDIQIVAAIGLIMAGFVLASMIPLGLIVVGLAILVRGLTSGMVSR